jgi:hypothetical protein
MMHYQTPQNTDRTPEQATTNELTTQVSLEQKQVALRALDVALVNCQAVRTLPFLMLLTISLRLDQLPDRNDVFKNNPAIKPQELQKLKKELESDLKQLSLSPVEYSTVLEYFSSSKTFHTFLALTLPDSSLPQAKQKKLKIEAIPSIFNFEWRTMPLKIVPFLNSVDSRLGSEADASLAIFGVSNMPIGNRAFKTLLQTLSEKEVDAKEPFVAAALSLYLVRSLNDRVLQVRDLLTDTLDKATNAIAPASLLSISTKGTNLASKDIPAIITETYQKLSWALDGQARLMNKVWPKSSATQQSALLNALALPDGLLKNHEIIVESAVYTWIRNKVIDAIENDSQQEIFNTVVRAALAFPNLELQNSVVSLALPPTLFSANDKVQLIAALALGILSQGTVKSKLYHDQGNVRKENYAEWERLKDSWLKTIEQIAQSGSNLPEHLALIKIGAELKDWRLPANFK